jgi:hypothetical protein
MFWRSSLSSKGSPSTSPLLQIKLLHVTTTLRWLPLPVGEGWGEGKHRSSKSLKIYLALASFGNKLDIQQFLTPKNEYPLISAPHPKTIFQRNVKSLASTSAFDAFSLSEGSKAAPLLILQARCTSHHRHKMSLGEFVCVLFSVCSI